MTNEGIQFCSELKQSYNFWERKRKWGNIQRASKTRKRADGKPEDPPDPIIETLSFADTDFFLNIRELLLLWATSPVESTEAGRAASGVRRLKAPYRSKMGDRRESDLNLLHEDTKRRSDIYQNISPKNVEEICTIRRINILESKRTNVCKILNI